MATGTAKTQIQSTAGAVPVRTEKGGYAMEKVKVTRYIAGKRPEYAHSASGVSSSESESDDDMTNKKFASTRHETGLKSETGDYSRSSKSASKSDYIDPKEAMKDPRMRRLMQHQMSRDDEDDGYKHGGRRHVTEPEIVGRGESDEDEEYDDSVRYSNRISGDIGRRRRAESSDEGEEDELSEDELERRRALIRMKNVAIEKEELLGKADESHDESEYEEEEESEYESDSEDDALQRLKPVFVRKRDRVTLIDNEKEQQKKREMELQKKFSTEERKRQSTKLVEDLVKLEVEMERKKNTDEHAALESVNTDDENEEIAYESWKIRELKRVKRTKEERELHEKEKSEISKIHSMSEEERRAFLRANPKVVTNKQQKGKYKFLQKYYHRGVYYLDDEDEVYKRNFAEATLEDHFDKTVLPKVMQVKDFGKAGRTKWSHLVAEDTTDFQSAWVADTAQNIKFFQKHGAGIKDVFERPALKKRKK